MQKDKNRHGASGRAHLGLASLVLALIVSGAVLAQKRIGVSASYSPLAGPSQSTRSRCRVTRSFSSM